MQVRQTMGPESLGKQHLRRERKQKLSALLPHQFALVDLKSKSTTVKRLTAHLETEKTEQN